MTRLSRFGPRLLTGLALLLLVVSGCAALAYVAAQIAALAALS